MKNIYVIVTAVIGMWFVLGISACEEEDSGQPPIVGKWEDKEQYYGWKDSFEIEADLEGKGEFWINYYDGTIYYSEYDLVAEKDGDKWIIEAEADWGPEYDFEMECEVDDDELKCECVDGYSEDWEWTFETD